MSDDIVVEFVSDSADEAEAAELERLTRALRNEILQIDEVTAVDQASAGPAPEGTKALELIAIGTLIVQVASTFEAVDKVVRVIRGWLAGRSSEVPPVKLSVGGNTIEFVPDKDQQDELVRQFMAALKQQSEPASSEG